MIVRSLIAGFLCLVALTASAQAIDWMEVRHEPVALEARTVCGVSPGRSTRHLAVASNGDPIVVGCTKNAQTSGKFDILVTRYAALTGAASTVNRGFLN